MDVLYENRNSSIDFSFSELLSPTVHLHREFEVVHVIEGTAAAYVDKNSYRLKPGDTFIVFPNQIHYYKSKEAGRFLVIIFSVERLHGIERNIFKSVPDTNCVLADEGQALSEVFRKMTEATGTYRNIVLGGYLNVMMGLLLPHLKLQTANAETNTALYNIIEFCSMNFRENITLDSLSAQLHLSKYYISHVINQNLHQNLNEYLSNLRIAEACLLLRETDWRITDISENVGFGTLRSFNRMFKKFMGTSPVKYRQKNSDLILFTKII